MEKEFIPYAEALALEELGFDSSKFETFIFATPENMYITPDYYVPNSAIWTPLYQQAFRWFREKYGYEVSIKKRKFEIQKLEIYGESDPDYYFTDFPFDSYEESELKCLRKLIEIVKRKNNLKS